MDRSTLYATRVFVVADVHSEAGLRTVNYAYDDYALYVLARHRDVQKNGALLRVHSERATVSDKRWGTVMGHERARCITRRRRRISLRRVVGRRHS
jgi:hypothetical protein